MKTPPTSESQQEDSQTILAPTKIRNREYHSQNAVSLIYSHSPFGIMSVMKIKEAIRRICCPRCGKLGIRSLVVGRRGNYSQYKARCYMVRHPSTPGILGIPEGNICFVSLETPEESDTQKQ